MSELQRYTEAISAFDKALALKPEIDLAQGIRLHCKGHLCDWSNFEIDRTRLLRSVDQGILNLPFALLAIASSPAQQMTCAKVYSEKNCPTSKSAWQDQRGKHDQIRVAYFSADFRDHPVAHLMAGVFEHHDRSRFETIAISFGPKIPSPMLDRLKPSFDQFIDVAGRSDPDLAHFLVALEIDILVDLTGYTQASRTAVLARRPSPLQVQYLGFPGTMGASFIDYTFTDRLRRPIPNGNITAKSWSISLMFFRRIIPNAPSATASRPGASSGSKRDNLYFAVLATITRSIRQCLIFGCAFCKRPRPA